MAGLLRVEPMQNKFLVAVSTAYKKAESQTVGLINIMGATQNEMSINKIEFLHGLADKHIERVMSSFKNMVSKSFSRFREKT